MLLSFSGDGSSGLGRLQFGDIGAAAAPLAQRRSLHVELSGAMTRVDVSQTVAVREHVTFGTGKPEKYLARCRLASRSVHDLDLAFLDEIVVLHDGIHAFDAVRNVDQARPVRRIKRHAVMFLIDAEIGYLADAVGHPRAQYRRP